MSDQELLSAISEIVAKAIAPLEKRIESLEKRVESLEKRMESLEKRVDSLEKSMNVLTKRVDSLEKEVRRNSIILENEVLPRLQTIEQCYVGSSTVFLEKSEQIDTMQDDVDVMKIVIQEHSVLLDKIS